MKKIKILFCFLFLSLCACKEQKKESNEIKSPVVKKNVPSVSNDNLNDFIGKYECRDTDKPNESLFLVLKKVYVKSISNFEGYAWEEKNEKGETVEMTLTGDFYGNTDLFDDAREGYEPGFFVANAQVEPLSENSLKVSLHGDSSDVLENPVNPPIKSTKEALGKGNKKWEITELDITRILTFDIKDTNELILKSDINLEDKIFKKIK